MTETVFENTQLQLPIDRYKSIFSMAARGLASTVIAG